MDQELEDLGVGGMIIGLIFLIPIVSLYRIIRFLVEPFPYALERIKNLYPQVKS